MNDGNNLNNEQRRQQIGDNSKNLESLADKLLGIMSDPSGIDIRAMNTTSKQIAVFLEDLIKVQDVIAAFLSHLMKAARSAAALGMDPDGSLYEGVKNLADCLNDLLATATEVSKHPKDENARERLAAATAAAQVN